MPTISLAAPPEPFSCSLCEHVALASKAGPDCNGCPAFKGTHYYPYGSGDDFCDVVVLGDVPEKPPINSNNIAWHTAEPHHKGFIDDASQVLQAAVRDVGRGDEFRGLRCRYLYAVKCAVDVPSRKMISACNGPLQQDFLRIHDKRKRYRLNHELVVLACGVNSLHALGIPVRSDAKAQGRIYRTTFAGEPISVVVTRSLKAIATATGKYSSLLADIERAFRIATDKTITTSTREDLEKGYIYPRTNAEVEALCELMASYSNYGMPASQWALAMDTETNTLFPHRKELIVTCISFAWDKGKAAAIPLWHPEITEKPSSKKELEEWQKKLFVDPSYDPKKAWETVRRFIERQYPPEPGDPKPPEERRKKFIFHNYKYDVKILWRLGLPLDACRYSWDVMSGEHVLEEDKKNQYNLKYLTRQYLPQYAGYEDRVHELLEEQDAERIRDEEEERESPENLVTVPKVVQDAFDRVQLLGIVETEGFRLSAIDNKIGDYIRKHGVALTEEQMRDIQIIKAAKQNGEFRKKKKKSEKKIVSGGYEKIALKELCFYAAVDTDVTRQLAMRQLDRMRHEDEKLEERRKNYEDYGKDTRFNVQRLCPNPNPLRSLTQDHYVPRAKELAHIEFNGIRIDRKYLQEGKTDLAFTIRKTKEQVFELSGEEFPLRSTRRLGHYLFNTGYGFIHPNPEHAEEIARANPEEVFWDGKRLSYKPHHFTVRGAVQTGAQVLQYLVARFECPLSNLLLAHSKAQKAENSFFTNIDKLAEHGYGWIHAGYNLNGTGTGRLSSSSGVEGIGFNNQNIPKGLIGALKDTHGKLILGPDGKPVFEGVNCKKLFLPDDDSFAFVNADAKGAEVAVFSAYARDAALIDALAQGMDAHSFFGSKCLNPATVAEGLTGEARRIALASAGIDDDHAWSYEDFLLGKDGLHPDKAYGKRLKKLRDNIKRLVFGLLYGAGYKKIADIAGISHEQAKKIQDLLFKMFPSIRTYMDRVKWELRHFRLAETYFGRRRRFPIHFAREKDTPKKLIAQAERRLLNFSIQSTNSDIVLMVLCWVAEVIRHDMGGRMLLTVHDSLGFQIPKRYVSQLKDMMYEHGTKRVAEVCPWMPVPYRWDVEVGRSYGEVDPLDQYIAKARLLPAPELDGYTNEEIKDRIRETTEDKPVKKVA